MFCAVANNNLQIMCMMCCCDSVIHCCVIISSILGMALLTVDLRNCPTVDWNGDIQFVVPFTTLLKFPGVARATTAPRLLINSEEEEWNGKCRILSRTWWMVDVCSLL